MPEIGSPGRGLGSFGAAGAGGWSLGGSVRESVAVPHFHVLNNVFLCSPDANLSLLDTCLLWFLFA